MMVMLTMREEGGPFVRCKAVKVLPLSATQKILQKRSELSPNGAFHPYCHISIKEGMGYI